MKKPKGETSMNIVSTEILWVARYDYKLNCYIKKHSHDYYQISYIMQGSGQFTVGNETKDLSAGQMLFCQPQKIHSILVSPYGMLKTIELKFVIYNQQLKKALGSINSMIDMPNIQSKFKLIHNEGMQQKVFYREACNMYLVLILLSILRMQHCELGHDECEDETLHNVEQNSVIYRFNEFVKNNYKREINLSDLAGEIGYNPNYLCQCVKSFYNSSPMKYLYNYRLNCARELILYSELSLNQVAYETGFKSIHHFSKAFKSQFGMPPGKFKRKEKEGVQKDVFFDSSFTYNNYIQYGYDEQDDVGCGTE